MWIGVVVFMMVNGQLIADSAKFKTEAECLKENADYLSRVVMQNPAVSGYSLECYDAEKLFTPKKPEPVKPAGSKEPGPKQTES